MDDQGTSQSDLDLEARRHEERRAVEEAGGGESEGFELAEEELIAHASHGDDHGTTRIIRDAGADEEAVEVDYAEGDSEEKPD